MNFFGRCNPPPIPPKTENVSVNKFTLTIYYKNNTHDSFVEYSHRVSDYYKNLIEWFAYYKASGYIFTFKEGFLSLTRCEISSIKIFEEKVKVSIYSECNYHKKGDLNNE